MKYTNSEKVDMLLLYGSCDNNSREAAKKYAELFPHRERCPEPQFFRELAEKLKKRGNFHEKAKRSVSGIAVLSEERFSEKDAKDFGIEVEAVLKSRIAPEISLKRVATELNVNLPAIEAAAEKEFQYAYLQFLEKRQRIALVKTSDMENF